MNIHDISMISEQTWNVIAHIKRQFGLICCGFGDFKQLKQVNEEHIDFRDSWIVKCVVDNNLCELKHIHRFNEHKLLHYAYTCVNGEHIHYNDYTKEEHDVCLCWTSQAVDSLNQTMECTLCQR